MKRILLFATLCLSLLFGGCVKRIVDVTVTIYGTVVDAETRDPLGGVDVSIQPGLTSKSTGDNGFFEFADIEQRQYHIQAKKEGYQTNDRWVNPNPGETLEIVIPLHKK